MASEDFFEEQTEQSHLKTEIVHEYFWIWSHIIAKHLKKQGSYKIGYVDLFSGPGKYKKDGTKSTPLIILETAIQHAEFSQTLATFFNDKEPDNYKDLEKEISNLPDINILRYQPVVENFEVDDSTIDWIEKNVGFPALFFLDPCGYKGLSLKLIQFILTGFGCDCIFFFNYNRINQHLENPVMTDNMNDFFGKVRAEKLRSELAGRTKDEREDLIIENLKDALVEHGGIYSIEYCFTKNDGNRTSHFLIFTTKHAAGFNKMKEIMAKKSSSFTHGIPSYKYNPAPTLFEIDTTIDDLIESLLTYFSEKSVTVREIYYTHGANTKYTLKNYQDALRKLEEQGKIITTPSSNERRIKDGIVTIGENVVVTFPEKRGLNGH